MLGSEQQTTMRVALYLRVSTEEQVERFGLQLQRESVLGLIKSRGKLSDGSDALMLAENHIYIDDGISGTIPLEERPGFSKLKEAIVNAPEGSKPFDAVAVFKIDRFARRLKILLDAIEFFNEYDIKFISANESIDTSTPFGKAILGIIGVIAELELETTKLRTQAGRLEAVKSGRAMGAFEPYGFKKNSENRLERFEPEAEVVVRIFDLFANEKMSTHAIAALFIREGVPSPAASGILHRKRKNTNKTTPKEFWRAERIMGILKDERYIGNYHYNRWKDGQERPREEWKLSEYRLPQIIDPVIFEKAQKLLLVQKHSRKTTHSGHTYLLSGLLLCDACRGTGKELAHWVGNGRRLHDHPNRFTYSYQCGRKNVAKSPDGCQTIPLPAKEIEEFVLNECLRIVGNPKGVYAYQEKLASTRFEMKQLQTKEKHLLRLLNSTPQQRDILREQHKEGIIDMEKLKQEVGKLTEREKGIKDELAAIQEKLSQKSVSQSYVRSLEVFAKRYKGSLNTIWKDRAKAYELLHSLVDSVIVYSRPITDKDVIAGKKRPNQLIPEQLTVKLRLPQEFLNSSLEKEQYRGSDLKFSDRAR